jgi:AcrR family transcriptional regulator
MTAERDSRERLLAAAWDLAESAFDVGEGVTRTTPRVFDQLTAARVSRHAGLTTGAFYNRWVDREAFLEDFLEYALAMTRSTAMDVVGDMLEDAETITPETLAVEAIRRTIDANIADTAFAMHLYLWALSRKRTVVVDFLRKGYEDSRQQVANLLNAFLAGTGREYRPLFDEKIAAALAVALVEGISIQRGIDPEAIDEAVVTRAIVAIAGAFSRRPDDEQTGFDLFGGGL